MQINEYDEDRVRDVRIVDATLFDGVGVYGTRTDPEACMEIAAVLEHVGVAMVECGRPSASATERERVRSIRSVVSETPLMCRAMPNIDDVEAAAAIGVDWVGISSSLECARGASNGVSVQAEREAIVAAIEAGRRLGLKVQFAVEYVRGMDWRIVARMCQAARTAGAARLCLTDDSGTMSPSLVQHCVRGLREAGSGCSLAARFNDDRGLALANALAAAESGADWLYASVNGVGKRCGIVDLASLVANLEFEGISAVRNPGSIGDVSDRVAAFTRIMPDSMRPVVGRNAKSSSAAHRRQAEREGDWPRQWMQRRDDQRGRAAVVGGSTVLSSCTNVPEVIPATELRYHKSGPGDRYVMIDERYVSDCRQYCIARHIPRLDDYGAGHVESHRHVCDSLFMFMGYGDGLSGLTVEVVVDGESSIVDSPCSVFIPSGVEHCYRVVSGTGIFVNHVLSGTYEASLLDPPAQREACG